MGRGFGHFDFDDVPMIDTYCPGCGEGNECRQCDWDLSIKPEPISDGMNGVAVQHIIGITCDHCNKQFPSVDWHRARERHVFAALGFVTPRLMQDAKVTA